MDHQAAGELDPEIWEAVDRYLAGEATLEEIDAIRARVRQLPELHGLLQDSHTYLGMRSGEAPSDNRATSWESLRSRIVEASSAERVRPARIPWSHVRRWYIGVALGVAAAIGVMTMSGKNGFRKNIPLVESHTYATRAGQRAEVTLPGEARAVLGPATTLTVTRGARGVSITVEGQALFSVTHSATTPFVVQTRQSTTRVLGTTFLVRQYATDHTARVVVTEGRVSVRDLASRVTRVLTANTLGIVGGADGVRTASDVSANALTAWTRGELVFQATPLRDVIADLNRAYDVNIQLADSTLAMTPIHWSVQTARYSLSQILPELLLMLNAQAKVSGRVITIIPGRPAAVRTAPARSAFTSESRYGR